MEEIITDHPVMLTGAPTLHRLGIQAFEPVLVEGRAIRLPSSGLHRIQRRLRNGDQMAVCTCLCPRKTQAEARILMLSANNLLRPQERTEPVTVPTQDMVLVPYYLTMLREMKKARASASWT
jgi:DNA-directed RNA polymerase subunit beta'